MIETPKLFTREGREFSGKITSSEKGWWGEEVGPCNRCGGAGASEAWRFTGMTCYRCGGKNSHRFEEYRFRLYTEDTLDKLNARAAEKQRKAEEKREQSARSYLANASEEVKIALDYAESTEHFLFNLAKERGLSQSEEADLLLLYKKHLDAVEEAARKERETYFLGEEGEKIEFWGTVKVNKPYAASFGYRNVENYFQVIITDDGQSVVYSGSKWYPVGARARFTAAVKECSFYKDSRQTKITRPTMHESGWFQSSQTWYRRYLREDLYAEVWPTQDGKSFMAGSYAESVGSREVRSCDTLEEAQAIAEADAQLLLQELYPPKPVKSTKKGRGKTCPTQIEDAGQLCSAVS